MERKIGEIFKYNGEWYQTIELSGKTCKDCYFYSDDGCFIQPGIGWCRHHSRNDNKSVIFKKLEKVGEPYEFDGHIFQAYHTFEVPIFTENYATVRELGNNSKISIEIKQNKEDMEQEIEYFGDENSNVKHSNSEKIGENLKPFNLDAAKQGKPVCTRDGRKARIICFDRKDIKPIVALVPFINGTSVIEKALYYFEDGYHLSKNYNNDNDLMMLPEKKEGWANVYKVANNNYPPVLGSAYIYNTKEDALSNANPDTIVATVKIEWEE